MAELKNFLMWSIILGYIAEEDVYNSGKYKTGRWFSMKLTSHNDHTAAKTCSETHIYKGNV